VFSIVDRGIGRLFSCVSLSHLFRIDSACVQSQRGNRGKISETASQETSGR